MANITDREGWFCVRSQPKHEHIAAAHLARTGVEVFNPQLRIRKPTRRGAVWFVEALFPGYLFARFPWAAMSMAVRATPGVSSLVSFGLDVPIIPDEVIVQLRAQFVDDAPHEVPELISDGDDVLVAGGPFHGLEAKVLRVMPPQGRIQLLIEILGQCTKVEISLDQVAREGAKTAALKRTPFQKTAEA